MTAITLLATDKYAKIALIGHDLNHLESVSKLLKSHGPDCTTLLCQVDITSTESWGKAAHEIRAQMGAWDLFLHAADGFFPNGLPETKLQGADDDQWWGIFESHVRSLQFIARHFVPKMSKHARLVNISLIDSLLGVPTKLSAQTASACAAAKVLEYLSAESGGRLTTKTIASTDRRTDFTSTMFV